MALTLQVKNELATVPVQKLCCRRSEIAATLRFAGGIHLVQHRHLTIEAEVDTGELRDDCVSPFRKSSVLTLISWSSMALGSTATLATS